MKTSTVSNQLVDLAALIARTKQKFPLRPYRDYLDFLLRTAKASDSFFNWDGHNRLEHLTLEERAVLYFLLHPEGAPDGSPEWFVEDYEARL